MNYRELISTLPIPTLDQTTAFVEHVGENHSWYKHLPFFPPGAGVVFFLNPNAGRAIEQTERGYTTVAVETGDYFRHHSRFPTAEYLQRFGFWDYWVDDNPRVPDPIEGRRIYGTEGEGELLPDAVKRRWSCRLTAFLKGGVMLRESNFNHERQEFKTYARQNASDPAVPRYRAFARAIGTLKESNRDNRVYWEFMETEIVAQRQLILQKLLTIRDKCAELRSPGA